MWVVGVSVESVCTEVHGARTEGARSDAALQRDGVELDGPALDLRLLLAAGLDRLDHGAVVLLDRLLLELQTKVC